MVARLLDELRTVGSSLPPAECETCTGPARPLVTAQGRVRCRACARTCPGCGRPTREIGRATCRRCTPPPGRTRGNCADCGQPDQLLDSDARCRPCRERVAHTCQTCGASTTLTRHGNRWRCHRCVLGDDLHDALGPAPDPALAGVADAILSAGDPLVTRRWLRRSQGGRLFGRLARHEMPLDHDTLDDFAPNRSVEHLRGLLVASGALEPDPDWLARLEATLSSRPPASLNAPTAGLLAAGCGGRPCPVFAAGWKPGAPPPTAPPICGASSARSRPSSASSTTTAEPWPPAGRPRSTPGLPKRVPQCHRLRPFLTWSGRRRHLPSVVLPARRRAPSTTPIDVEGRWTIARRLVHDPTLGADDRIAWALEVLYAQPVSRVAALTLDDLHRYDGHVTITVSGVDLELPEPFATYAAERRRRRNGVADQLPTPWLFPAARADRHVSHNALSARLCRLGIQPRQARLAALGQLAAELPPALLAHSIGISPVTAARWAGLTGGNWTTYAADHDA